MKRFCIYMLFGVLLAGCVHQPEMVVHRGRTAPGILRGRSRIEVGPEVQGEARAVPVVLPQYRAEEQKLLERFPMDARNPHFLDGLPVVATGGTLPAHELDADELQQLQLLDFARYDQYLRLKAELSRNRFPLQELSRFYGLPEEDGRLLQVPQFFYYHVVVQDIRREMFQLVPPSCQEDP